MGLYEAIKNYVENHINESLREESMPGEYQSLVDSDKVLKEICDLIDSTILSNRGDTK